MIPNLCPAGPREFQRGLQNPTQYIYCVGYHCGGLNFAMRRTRLQIAKPDIVKHFDQLPQRVFRRFDIGKTLAANRAFWRLAERETVSSFVDFLVKGTKLTRVRLKFPSRPETCYAWGDVPLFQILLAMKPKAYLSHYSALYLHDLTDQIPKTVFLNEEQSPKPPPPAGLSQERIAAAFRRAPRRTSRVAEFRGHQICLLSGKHTGQLGVVERNGPEESSVRLTSLERTLIDITVRPYYAGGVAEVLEAFRRAQPQVSINRLCAYLAKLDYVYPYHQAIGFYLERAGNYRPGQIRLLQKPGLEYDFYLTYQMDEPSYSSRWRLYVPKGL